MTPIDGTIRNAPLIGETRSRGYDAVPVTLSSRPKASLLELQVHRLRLGDVRPVNNPQLATT
ncbi:hypothetical protein ACT009_02005 [Sphingomonas sp. Tas61C01]|uniref:hypothetical protein n=1 Tax=Sphingomonas sp. Tas61C01 TaxID=3458297 RepID=UPI00403EA6E9